MKYKSKKERNRAKLYYIGLNKANNSIIIALTKAELGRFLGISIYIITKCLKDSPIYEGKEYIIWKNIGVNKVKRGYALKYRKC